jgi:hypothetical protein
MNDHDAENYSYIVHDLERLANSEAQLDVLKLQEQEAVNEILTDDICQQLDDIHEDFASQRRGIELSISTERDNIKQDVLEHGETVKGEYLQAVWNKGRVSWNAKALVGYAVSHPEILELRKFGDPSVTIRKI